MMAALVAAVAAAQDVDFTISLDRAEVAKGKQAVLSARVAPSGEKAPGPEIPFIDGLNIRYQETAANPDGSATHTYKVIPMRLGRFKIGPLDITLKGKKIISNSIMLEAVDKEPDLLSAPSPSEDASGLTRRIFVELDIPRKKLYTSERMPLQLALYSDWLDLENITVTGISTGELVVGDFEKGKTSVEDRVGEKYAVLTYDSFVTAPASGRFTLPPVKVSFYIARIQRPDGGAKPEMLNDNEIFYDRILGSSEKVYRQLETEPLEINVTPLPTVGVPGNFRGAIGSFELEASVSPSKVKAGEPLTVKAVITGRGNFSAITSLGLENESGFKAYDAKFTPEKGRLIIEQVLRPLSSDAREVPEIVIPYFDPDKGEYLAAQAGPFPIKVEGVVKEEGGFRLPLAPKTEPKVEKKVEIVGPKKSPGPAGSIEGLFFFREPFVKYIFFFPLVVFLAALPVKRHLYRLETDAEYVRRLRSSKLIRREMPALERLARSGQAKAFYDRAFLFVEHYLALGWKIEDEKTLAEIRKVYDDCYFARFAPGEIAKDDAAATLAAIKDAISALVHSR